MEYSLLGQRHAFPRSEVKDIIDFIPYRRIPNVPAIVIGVAEHNETLLPVLDLAMVFGRRSLATPEWRMLQVENGDFQALVITEAVFGERPLPLPVQRAVPIHLPHHVVYGCYPDADAVRLILNVEAMAVHFEKALVRELLSAMSPEMKQAPAEIVPSLFEETEVPSAGMVVSEASKEQYPIQEPTAALQSVEMEQVSPILEQPALPEVIEAAQVSEETEKARKEAEDQAMREVEEQAKIEAVEKALREAEERQKAEAATRAAEEERIRGEAEELARQEAEEQARRAAEAKALREAEEQQGAEAAARVAEEERVRREAEEEIREAEEKSRREAEELARREAGEQAAVDARRKDEAEKKAREEAAAVVREAEDIARREKEKAPTQTAAPATLFKSTGAGAALREALSKPSVRRKSFASLVIIGVVILAFLYAVFRKPSVEVQGPKAPVETAQKKTKGPLVLTVPSNAPLEAGTYVVKEGDTLWGISKRFTGNPFNYPSIAGENDIPNPDLIFPEQEILIEKKE
jgi:nucleoid-associated protein YgaU/chemotaxis signal transduction protein